jgi:hypothetical protein
MKPTAFCFRPVKTERATKQSPHSDDANKFIDISKRETKVRNISTTILYVIENPASFPTREKKPDYICFIHGLETEVEVWAYNI